MDEESGYYVAMPDVNLFSKELTSYDITVIYNNDYAEKINGYHYDKKILYIPKDVIDDPKNENPLYDGGPLAVQINYAFGGLDTDSEGNADFGKTLPVQILNSKETEPDDKSLKVENIFEESVTVPDVVKGKEGYKKENFKVFLNGMTVPIAEDSWDYEDGDIVIYSSPAIISNINILYEGKGPVAKALSVLDHLLSLQVNAASDGSATNTGDMKFYKSITGKNVVLELDPDSMYVGWRGVFTSNVLFAPHGPNYDNGHKMGNYNTIMNWKKNNTHPDTYDELFNSAGYLYGGYTPHDTDTEKQYWNWALESYTVGKNKANDASDALSRDTKIEANEGSGMANRTIYEWFIAAQKKLEKAVSYFGAGTDWAEEKWGSDSYVSVGGVEQNGIGGDTNFAFKIPKNSTISGSDKNLVSDKDSAGYGSGNPDIKFTFSNFPDDSIYLAAGCTHFDELASGGTDDNGNDEDTIYVSCLDYKPDDGYIVLAFTTSGQQGYIHMQEAVAVYKFKVEPKYPVRLKKESSLTAISSGNAVYADLSGAKYGIYESKANAEEGKDAVATLTSKADGTTNEVSLPKGTYYAKELTAPKNYAVDSEIVKVTVTGSSTVQTFTMSDPPQNNPLDLVLVKIDKETGKAEPQGEGTLSGAEFTVKYFDNESGTTSGTAKKTWVFKTDAKGEVHLKDSYKVSGDELYKNTAGNETLPVGTYSVQETKAPTGYIIVDTSPAVQVVKASGKAETFTAFVTKNVPNQIIRGGVQIKKEDTITGGTPQGDGDLSGITFEITNESTQSVRVDGKDYAKGAVVKSIVTDAKGIAKTGNKDLPYDTYVLNELSCKANEGAKLIKNREFTIRVDKRDISLGTIDDPSDKQIGTLAADGLTKDHFGSNASESIIDTVTYKGLTKGQPYTMKGTLMDKATEEPVMVNGKKVTAKETFTAEESSGTVTITFTFPKEALKGKEVVAFETCEINGKVIASHEDIEDADQTVVYPEIGTEAKDGQTESHFGLNDSTSINDSVKYMNLKPGKEYTMTGTLMDKSTGKALTGADGKKITVSNKFTAGKANGSVVITFKVPGELVKGKKVVAFESCTYKGIEVAFHADLSDKDQTVEYPKDETPDKPSGSTPSKKEKTTRTVSSSPKTGDKNNIALWIGIILLSSVGMAAAVIALRKSQKKKRNKMY